jgi:putative nucleotidyltransferase with HDIG domain
VPAPLRPRLTGRAREGGASDPPALTQAERSALGVIAEHVRERVGLKQIWIFARAPGGEAGSAIEDVARASAGGDEIPDGAARVVAVGAVRGSSQRRFVRRSVTSEGGVHVVTAEATGGRLVAVVAAADEAGRLREETEAALVELADIATRVLADAPAQYPREAGLPAREDQPARPAAYGASLADALALLRRPPILAESRVRLVRELGRRYPATGSAIRTIETDIGLALAVMGAANRLPGRPRGGFASVAGAIEAVGARALVRLAESLPTLSPAGGPDRLGAALVRLSAHSIATCTAADVLARQLGDPRVDELRLIAAIHDVGKVALAGASGDYLTSLADVSVPPEERLVRERRRLGIDHAAIGAVAVRRLGLPKQVAAAVERHHADDATGQAALIRMADMLAHQAHGDAVTGSAVSAAAAALRLGSADVQRIAYDLTRSRERREPSAEPSPLTPMQQKALLGLAAGRTYKQIATDLSVSESTVRTHLHNLYGKLEVSDRAQAVLLAAERGWI